MSEGQTLALEQLRELASVSNGGIDMLVEPSMVDEDGFLRVQVSLDCSRSLRAAGGLALRRRERFIVVIPVNFPFDVPAVWVPHYRWAGSPHVQWGALLCLYAAMSIEWMPADGMLGLIDRLSVWLERAALGELDPEDQPLHPPVAYTSSTAGVMVIRADIGDLAPFAEQPGRRRLGTDRSKTAKHEGDDSYRLVVGLTESHGNDRCDVVEWMDQAEWLRRFLADELPAQRDGRRIAGVLAVLTDSELSFEYPKQAAPLIGALEAAGVQRHELFSAIGEVGAVNYELASQVSGEFGVQPPELHLLVGTPSRRANDGALRQHLVCWRLDEAGRFIAENLLYDGANEPALARLGTLAQELLPIWIESAETTWTQVMEARSEVTVRRDSNSASEWLRGKRVLVLGCGALGGPIVEFCVRAGVAQISIVDNDVVTPGILVRQSYSDCDIGTSKALSLAKRLNQVRLDAPVRATYGTVQAAVLATDSPPPDIDLVVDATADSAVRSLLELRRERSRVAWPPVMTVLIGHDARRGVVTVSKRGATGAGCDILRRLSLAGRQHRAVCLADIAADLFPTTPRTSMFQPEPGCSSPTFTGAATDVTALAAHLFDAGLRGLIGVNHEEAAEPMVAAAVRLDGSAMTQPAATWLGWPNDEVLQDLESGYEIRIGQPALAGMRSEVRRGARLRGPRVETGGLLLGQVDDACRCVWIDEVSGPPRDSLLSAVHFDHGIDGVEELIAYHRDRSGRLTTFLGMWHSHPYGKARPSETDRLAMAALVTPVVNGPRRALIVIVGGDETRWPSWINGSDTPEVFARFVKRSTSTRSGIVPSVPESHQSDGWPGGWASRPHVVERDIRKGGWSMRFRLRRRAS